MHRTATKTKPVRKDRDTAKTLFLNLGIATAVFVIAEVQFIPRTVAIAAAAAVAAIGVVSFGARTHPLLWLLPAAMLATALWSTDPVFTILSLGVIVIPVILAGTVVKVCDPDRFLRALAVWARVALILSFVLFFLVPSLGAHTGALYDGAMRGLFAHKNGLSRILLIGVFAEIFLTQRQRNRVFWLAAFLAASLLTRSLTFFILMALIVILVAVLRSVKWGDRRSVGLFLGIAPLIAASSLVVAITLGPGIIERSGRFSAEDDRGRIWRGVLSLFEQKPWGGWGYGQVFRPDTPAGEYLTWAIGWTPTAAHSGYVGALVEGGWLGLSALVLTLVVAIGITWRARSVLLWPFVYSLVITANNVTDSRAGSIEWFLLSAGILYAAQQSPTETTKAPPTLNRAGGAKRLATRRA